MASFGPAWAGTYRRLDIKYISALSSGRIRATFVRQSLALSGSVAGDTVAGPRDLLPLLRRGLTVGAVVATSTFGLRHNNVLKTIITAAPCTK